MHFPMLFVLYSWLLENGWIFTSMYFVSSENDSGYWIRQYNPFGTKIDKLTLFIKNLVVFGSSIHEFETCYGCVFA